MFANFNIIFSNRFTEDFFWPAALIIGNFKKVSGLLSINARD
jgi:hypothetical protein